MYKRQIVGLPLFSAFDFRTIMWFVYTVIVCIVISIYATRVKKDSSKSYVKGIDTTGLGFSKDVSEYKINRRQIWVLLVILFLFVGIVVGSSQFG